MANLRLGILLWINLDKKELVKEVVMKRAINGKKNIFCVEGNWNNNLESNSSLHNALRFIAQNNDIKYIHRNCSTNEQLEDLLKHAALKKYEKYGIIYLAFHGHPGVLQVAHRKKMTLPNIAEIVDGHAVNKIIHFGSCSTLKISSSALHEFFNTTKALAISGYAKDITFKKSMLMDIAYFELCQQYQNIKNIDNAVRKYYPKLADELGFRMYYDPD